MLKFVADLSLPILIIVFLIAGLKSKINVFNAFLVGAEKGLNALLKTAPALISLTFAVKLLRASGVLEFLVEILVPVCSKLGFPAQIMPLALLRPISGSGSTALLSDIFETFGPDSKIGLMASVLCCSSETTFYTVAVYYGSCSIKNTRHTILAAIIADIAAVVFSVFFVNLMFTF